MTDDFVLRRADFSLGDEQAALQAVVRTFFEKECPTERVRGGRAARVGPRPVGPDPGAPARGDGCRRSVRRRRCRSRRARDPRRGGGSPRRAGAGHRDDGRRGAARRGRRRRREGRTVADPRGEVATIAVAVPCRAAARACGRHRADRRWAARRRPDVAGRPRSSARGGEPGERTAGVARSRRGCRAPRRRAGSGTVRSGEGRVAHPHCGRARRSRRRGPHGSGCSTRRTAARSVPRSVPSRRSPIPWSTVASPSRARRLVQGGVVRRPRTRSIAAASMAFVRLPERRSWRPPWPSTPRAASGSPWSRTCSCSSAGPRVAAVAGAPPPNSKDRRGTRPRPTRETPPWTSA